MNATASENKVELGDRGKRNCTGYPDYWEIDLHGITGKESGNEKCNKKKAKKKHIVCKAILKKE